MHSDDPSQPSVVASQQSESAEPSDEAAQSPSMHTLDFKQEDSMTKKKMQQLTITFSAIALVVGSLTGFGVWKLQNQTTASSTTTEEASGDITAQVAGDNVKAGDVFGSPNAEIFRDSAEGYLQIGGLDGEGSHNLLRPGGESQTVYMTSSVTDLDKFDGMEVKVWGETQKGQKAGWLMDVGRVEVVKVDGTSPLEE